MKRFLLPFLLVSCSILISGCESKKEDTNRLQAQQLYSELIRTLNQYIDSISHAPDSAKVNALAEQLSDNMTDLYFKYSPEAGLKITEAENDQLTSYTDSIIRLRDSLLYRFAHPIELSDSVPRDSLALDSIKKEP